ESGDCSLTPVSDECPETSHLADPASSQRRGYRAEAGPHDLLQTPVGGAMTVADVEAGEDRLGNGRSIVNHAAKPVAHQFVSRVSQDIGGAAQRAEERHHRRVLPD